MTNTMKKIHGIWLPATDDHFEEHLRESPPFAGAGTYQLDKIWKAMECCPGNRRGVALDIGAHVGLWSRVLAAQFDRVMAFEPVTLHASCFRRNLEHINNVELHEVALGERKGEAEITIEEGNSGNAHMGEGGARVQVVTLDGLNLAAVDFVKIDCEGFEYFVLKGGERTIREQKPLIVVEQKRGHAQRYGLGQIDAVKLLQSWGAHIFWEKSGDFCMGWYG